MAAYVLPTTVYQAPPQVQREARVTLIEDEIQVNIPSYRYPSKLMITSPLADDVPTPRGVAANCTPATDATSDASSMWSLRSSQSSYDSLYDVTDESEGEEVPLKLSASVKKHVDKERSRCPSLVIPSPSQWPSIHKPQSSCAIGLSPASKLAPSPSAFSVWQAQRFRIASGTSTPSLDGSLTSEELALSSCPSTPDLASREENVDEWEPPCQLDPHVFETLHQLSPEEAEREVVETVVEVSEEAAHEMKEIVKSTPIRLDFALLSVDPEDQNNQDPVSALSVPSPGGFFSSLAPVAAQTWAIRTPEPSTSVAENFYGVPWRAGHPTEQTIVTSFSPTSRGPPTAIRSAFSPVEEVEIAEITDVCQPSEYNAEYQEKLKQSALAHFERTKGWLDDQSTIVRQGIDRTPSTPDMGNSPIYTSGSPSKKSVRFVPETPKPSTSTQSITATTQSSASTTLGEGEDEGDRIFLEGFKSIMKRHKPIDAFVHRQTRLEAVHIARRNFPSTYCTHLTNTFSISSISRPAPTRPISTMLPTPAPEAAADSEMKETIAAVERERQVLEQVSPAAWELQAMCYLRGGSLLSPTIISHIQRTPHARILDFGGKPNCDWGWQAATLFPSAKISTVYLCAPDQLLPGPPNFSAVQVEKPFALPFADATFDVVSARTLHSLLKSDELDLTLAELFRVLKPSGYFDFCLIDALLANASRGSWAQVMNAEFGHKLASRGYEREPTRYFVDKLIRTGFGDVRRGYAVLSLSDVAPAWKDEGKIASPAKSCGVGAAEPGPPRTRFFSALKTDECGNVLVSPEGKPCYHEPALTGSTAAVAPVTALLGARMWEQWAYKLARESGGREAEVQMVDQVCDVLEQGGKIGCGVTCLMGYARK